MKNLTFKAAALNDGRPTVNRRSTDGQSQRRYSLTPITKRRRVLMTLVFLFTFAIGNVLGADDVYYVMLYNNITDAGVLTSSSTLNYGIVKYSASTGKYASSTEITVEGMGTSKASKYSQANISTFSTVGNWAAGSGTAYAAGGKFTALTIKLGTKTASSIKFIGYRNTSSTGEMTISETAKATAKKPSTYGNDCLLEWTGNFTGDVSVSVKDNKEHVGVFVITVPEAKYSVTYKAGDGTGDDVVDSDAKTVKAFADCSFTAPTGYEFKEWQDAGSTVVAAGDEVKADMTLTAIYRLIPTKYTVTYSLNGAPGDAPTETDKAAGDAFNLAAAPSWAGHAFDGWLCSADAAVKAAGSSYTMTAENTTFTAQWHEVDCKIYSFTGGIGSAEGTAGDYEITSSALILKNTNARIKLTPAGGETFKAGDIITISGYTGSATKKFGVYVKNAAGSSNIATAEVANLGECIASATLSADAEYVFLARKEGTTMNILTCEIHRSCAEGTAAGLSYATAEVNKTEGDAAFTNALTNANGLVVAGYSSSNTAVATIASNGQVTIVAPGSATITAHSAVQTKAGTLYAAGTATYTLNVAALPEYTVTYDLNGGSGDPTEVDHKAGEKFNLHDGVTGITAPTSKTFVNWKDQDDALFAGGAEYTMPAKNVTLTAQWAGDVYTVKYMDGEDLLDTKVVEVGNHPADIEHPTKPLYTFASWQLSGSDVVLDDVNGTKDAEIILTVRWAKVYASSYDMEAYAASDGASKAGLETALTAAGYAYTNINGIDNGHTHNYTYDGMKYKTNDGDLSFNVIAGKVVEVKTGYLPSNDAVTMYINGVADATVFESAVEASETHKMNYFYSATEALYRLDVKASKGTCAVKKVTIRDPYQVSYNTHGADEIAAQPATPSVTLPTPVNGTGNFKGWYDAETEGNKIGNAGAEYMPTANITLHAQWETVSSDNTLSDLQVDGATVAGFDPAVQIYNLVYEYGQQPVITSATATAGALATVTINNTPVEEATFKYVQVKVEAESGAERFYQVRYTNNPKQGATIFKAELTSNTAADYSGMYADGDNSEIKLADDGANGYKFAGKSNYIKMAITDAMFAEGDMLKMTYTTNPQQGELAIYDGTTKLQGTAYSNHILTFSDAADGKSTLFIRRTDDNNFNGWVSEVEVQRYMAPIIKSYKIGAVSGTIDQDLKTIAIELPYGTSLYGVAATIEAYANGGATVIAPTPLAYDTPLGYKVSSAYAEDGDVDYTVTITEAEHYEAMIVGGANYTTLVAAVAAAQADDVVKLLDNVDLMATGLTIAENITLDLNGFNIKAGEQLANNINVPAGVKLTLVDNSANAEGKIYTEEAYTGSVNGYGVIRVAGEFLMQSGNIYAVIESDPANLGQFAVVLGAGGKATIEGGQIKAGWYAISNNGNNTGSTIIVSGGELISTADFAIYNPAKESTVTVTGGVVYGAAGGIAMNRGELTVTGGTITSKDQGTTGTWGDGTGGLSNAAISASGKYESVEVEISGGTIIAEGTAVMITNGTTNPVEIAISGGQFSHVVPAEYCADGFAPVTTPNAQGKYEVEDKRIYIFDGSTMSNMATSPSGAISWEIVGSTMGAGDKDKTYEGVHYTRALSCGSSSTTKHFRIDVALNNAAKIEVIGMSNSSSDTRRAWLTNSTEKGDFADAIAGLTTTGYNPEMFTTDWLEEGSYYLHSDNTVAIFLIRVTSKEVDPKCEQPTITTQPATDLTFGAGNMTATVEAEVSDEGTLTYQWYNAANDEAVVGQTTATLTTAVEGTYYVIVTNTKASHRDNSIKSDEAQLAHRVMNDATLSALSASVGTLDPAFDPAELSYRVDLAKGTTVVPTLSATATMDGYANIAINDAAEFVNYEATSTVVVTSEDGTATKTYTVHYYVAHPVAALVDVTANTTWDWTTITARADGSDIDEIISEKAHGPRIATADGLILANYVLGGDNWDKIEGNNSAYAIRNSSNKYYQGASLHMHTTVSGYLKIHARNDGNTMTLSVQNAGRDMSLGSLGNWKDYTVYVQAGDVVIYNVPETAGKPMRIDHMEFTVDNTPDYTRTEMLGNGVLGTICLEYNVPAGGIFGVTVYELMGRDYNNYGKLVFDEIVSGEMEAGVPYLFQAHGDVLQVFYGETHVDNPVDKGNGMYGTFTDQTLTELDDVYYFAQRALWSCDGLASLSLPANRAYVKLSEIGEVSSPTPNPARRRITMAVNGEKVATGIDNLEASEKPLKLMIDGQMYILRGEKLFDATGRLVK